VFKVAPTDQMFLSPLANHMAKSGIKTVAAISFNDGYGQSNEKTMAGLLKEKGIEVVSEQWYARSDTSVVGQMLKVIAAKHDAVFIAGSNEPAALPQVTLRERGYKGPIYQTSGAANYTFIKIGGPAVEGAILAATPVVVAEQLPDSNPAKAVSMEFVNKYGALPGADPHDMFAAMAWDGGMRILAAIPAALREAQPGTERFRSALRDSIENLKKLAGASGVFTPSPTDHVGLEPGTTILMEVKGGRFVAIK
jgi:branched-chain amino acid transport system substrate-binding protein